MKSIMQNDENCFLCGLPARYDDPLDTHHCFGASNRNKSEEDGLVVKLHHKSCHIFGKNAVHNHKGNMVYLKQQAQQTWQDYYGRTKEDFIARYGRNYLD